MKTDKNENFNEYDVLNTSNKTLSVFTINRLESYVFEDNAPKEILTYELTFKEKILWICNIFRSFVGFGILVLPKASQGVGVLGSFIGFFIAYSILYYGLFILSKVADKSNFNDSKYEILVSEILGNKNKLVAEISIIILQIGTAIPSVYLSTRFLNYIFCLYKITFLCDNYNIILLYGFLLSLPMISIKSIKTFSFISAISTIIILISIISIMVDNFIKIFSNPNLIPQNFILIEIKNLPVFIGICLFAAEGIGLYIPLRKSSSDHSYFKFIYLFIIKILFFVYIIFSMSSYLVYGKDITNFIFFSINKNEHYLFFLGILYASCMFLSFPIVYFPIYSIIEGSKFFLSISNSLSNTEDKNKLDFLKLIIRFICLTFTYLVVLIGPDLLEFLSLVGSISTFILMIYFPVMMFNKVFKNNNAKKKFNLSNNIFLTFGSLVCLIIFFNSWINLFK